MLVGLTADEIFEGRGEQRGDYTTSHSARRHDRISAIPLVSMVKSIESPTHEATRCMEDNRGGQ